MKLKMRIKIILGVLLLTHWSSSSITSSESFEHADKNISEQQLDEPDGINSNITHFRIQHKRISNEQPHRKNIANSKYTIRTRFRQQPSLIQHQHVTPICKCRRQDFIVNFYDLGWGKWIIYPKVFNAHRCEGDCSLPSMGKYAGRRVESSSRSVSVKMTNHAQIMSILELKHPELAKKQMSKCVSTRLKPLTVIFLDERGRIKTKQYRDMIVEECGCR